jgi:hypothetical protein
MVELAGVWRLSEDLKQEDWSNELHELWADQSRRSDLQDREMHAID